MPRLVLLWGTIFAGHFRRGALDGRCGEQFPQGLEPLSGGKRRAWVRAPWEEPIGVAAESRQFHCAHAWRDRSGAHINILELRARGVLLRRLSRRVAQHHNRIILLMDSRVAVSAGSKGRSPSANINAELCKQLPDLLGADLETGLFWVESARNPMDNPSRGRPVWEAVPTPGAAGEWLRGYSPLVLPAVEAEWRDRTWRANPPPPLIRRQ